MNAVEMHGSDANEHEDETNEHRNNTDEQGEDNWKAMETEGERQQRERQPSSIRSRMLQRKEYHWFPAYVL